MSHPGDHGGFRSLLDRNAFGSSDRAAADRRSVIGDSTTEPLCEIGVITVFGFGPATHGRLLYDKTADTNVVVEE